MVLDPWTIDPSLVCASEDAHRACGSITPPPRWLCYQSSTLYAVIIRWDGNASIIQCSLSLHSAIPEPGVFFEHRESRPLKLEKCAQTIKEGGAIFALFRRFILGEMSVFDDALGLHFPFCQQLAQLIEAFGRLANDFAHDWFADFQNVAIGRSTDGGGAAFASQERHFAEAITGMQCANANWGSIFCYRNIGAAAQKQKHRIALGAFHDDAFASAEMIESRMF